MSAVQGVTLLRLINAHCRRNGIAETRFCRVAVNDPRFISDLRTGRQPGARVTRRVLAAIEGRA